MWSCVVTTHSFVGGYQCSRGISALASESKWAGTGNLQLCFEVTRMAPPLWSIGQSSWLQIQRSGFDSLALPDFREVVGLERGPLSLVSITEELLGRNSSSSGLENRAYGCGDPLRNG
jgi:hypothetical protein